MKFHKPKPQSIAVNQPFFLPYLGYFSLLGQVETFVVLDSVQYLRKSWANRNRIPATHGPASEQNWTYFGVPLKKMSRDANYSDASIFYDEDWQGTLRKTLQYQYSSAPYYKEVMTLLEPMWERHEKLVDLNISLLKSFTQFLGFDLKWIKSSQLEQEHPQLKELKRTEKIIGICKTLGAKYYRNLPGGRSLYFFEEFKTNGMQLEFVPLLNEESLKKKFPRASGLSILDVAFYHTAGEILEMLSLMEDQLFFKPVDLTADRELLLNHREDFFRILDGDLKRFQRQNSSQVESYFSWVQKKQAENPGSVVLALDQDRVVGHIELGKYVNDQSFGFLHLLYVPKAFRGTGQAKKVLEYAYRYWKKEGHSEARLSVEPQNERAISFYKKQGWEVLGPRPDKPEVLLMGFRLV